MLTGRGADMIIIDDPLKPEEVKAAWFASCAANERPDKFDQIVQSWDTANKASELSPHPNPPPHALGHAHMFAWTFRVAGRGPSPPACGGRGRGPSRSEERVRWAVSLLTISPTSPRPSPPQGRRGGPWPRDVMCACPSPRAGEGRKGWTSWGIKGKDLYLLQCCAGAWNIPN